MIWSLHYWPRTWIQVGCLAFLIAALGMPFAIRLLKRFGAIDRVASNKIHQEPVVRGGGIMIYIAFAVAVLWPGYRSYEFQGILIGSFICLAVGAIDDIRGGLPALWKLVTLFIVTLVLSRYGVQLKLFSWYPLDLAFTMLWLVGVTSAFNGLDNMDGLASGTASIVSSMFLVISVQSFLLAGTETHLSWFGMLSAGLVGANLGFLLYNFRPAKIFMGDSGSFFLGFTLAALGVMGEWTPNRIIACTIPILILGVPIFDFAYIILMRIWRGETRTVRDIIEHCGTDHLSHRLVWMGFSQRKAVLFIYLISFALGITGVLLHNSTSNIDSVLALLQGAAIVLIIIGLMAAVQRRHSNETREADGAVSDD
jgi:UDP-GlcNAc:undecaprenyl-phosphate GlcNAc-1-phosphate transferase